VRRSSGRCSEARLSQDKHRENRQPALVMERRGRVAQPFGFCAPRSGRAASCTKWGGHILQRAVVGIAKEGGFSSAARQDCAVAAAVRLTNNDRSGRTYELAANRAFMLTELSVEASRQAGQAILPRSHRFFQPQARRAVPRHAFTSDFNAVVTVDFACKATQWPDRRSWSSCVSSPRAGDANGRNGQGPYAHDDVTQRGGGASQKEG
jgi:hypothetical protein